MPFENVVKRIMESTGLSLEEIDAKVLEKQSELSGLVSKEGAAYIVAKELGLDLVEHTKHKVNIKNIIPNIRNLTLRARVVNAYPVREYQKRDGTGSFKVANVIFGDESGTIRMSLWDDQTELIEKLTPGMAIEVFGAYSRDNRGEVEIRIGRRGGVREIEDSGLPELEVLNTPKRIGINELDGGKAAEIKAVFVQLFDSEHFYEICPECSSRIKEVDGKFKCKVHGDVAPNYSIVVSGVVDDGSGNMRAVFFRDVAAKLLGMTMEEVISKRGKVFENVDLLGKEFVLSGRARNNQMFSRIEFIVNDLKPVNIEEEVNTAINALGG